MNAPLAPTRLVTTVATIDTIEMFFRRPPTGLRTRIEKALGRRIAIKPCHDRTGYQQGVRAIINGPNLAVLPVLGHIWRADKSCCTSRVDVAVDFTGVDEPSAEAVADWLDRHLVLKWRSAQTVKTHIGRSVYWADHRRSRNLVMYWKRKTRNVIRLELRFFNTAAVRRAGLDDPEKLARANPAALFQHHIKPVGFKPTYVAKAVRRSRVPKRVLHVLGEMDMQGFVSGRRKLERFIEKIEGLVVPCSLSWVGTVITPNIHPPA